jgi:isoquinoline 1-oxidoreductase beta subunit
VLWWRSVGSTHTAYVMETLIDEIAVATGQDPVAYRMKLMGSGAPRHRAALQLAVDKSGYGTRKLPAGTAWGVAVHESFETVVAYVVEARMIGRGKEAKPKLVNVTAAVHCNFCVNPRTVEAQVQGSAVMALGMTLPGEHITLKDGVVEQGNFHPYAVPGIGDAPTVAVHIVTSSDPPKGMGERGLPPLAPAYANARLTGKRLRELPFQTVWRGQQPAQRAPCGRATNRAGADLSYAYPAPVLAPAGPGRRDSRRKTVRCRKPPVTGSGSYPG